MTFKISSIIFLSLLILNAGCAKKKGEDSNSGYLYVSSGACYGGNNTTFSATTASNVIFKVNLATGAQEETIADYNVSTETPGNTPVSLQNYDDDNLMVMVDNTTSTGNKRIEKIPKSTAGNKSTFLQNSTVFGTTGAMRSFKIFNIPDNTLSDGSFFIAHAGVIDKTNSIGTRQLSTGQAWLSATSGACQSNTNITAVNVLSNGKMLFSHAASGQNKFGIISVTGYANNVVNCLATQAAPTANSYPTAMVYIPSVKQVLVAYAGNSITTDYNSIYAYDIDETGNTISGATKAFEDTNILYGITAMAYDTTNETLYVATQNSTATTATGYNIEKFNYDSGSKTLTRATTTPFSTHTYKTKCISSMALEN